MNETLVATLHGRLMQEAATRDVSARLQNKFLPVVPFIYSCAADFVVVVQPILSLAPPMAEVDTGTGDVASLVDRMRLPEGARAGGRRGGGGPSRY